MRLKAIILFLFIPLFGLSQNLNVDELIKMSKMNKKGINDYLISNNWEYGGFNNNQYWWTSVNEDLIMLERADNNDNIIHLVTMNNGINNTIKNQIARYKMRNIEAKTTGDGISYKTYEGASYVIILMRLFNENGEIVTKTSLLKKEIYEKYK